MTVIKVAIGASGVNWAWRELGSGNSDGVAVMGYSRQWVGVKISIEFMVTFLLFEVSEMCYVSGFDQIIKTSASHTWELLIWNINTASNKICDTYS